MSAPMTTVVRGREAESAARRHLEGLGWRIVAANWRAGRLEIDLIAEADRMLVFVEVKSRREDRAYDPLAALRPAQKRRLVAASRYFLDRHPAWGGHYCRYDVVFLIRNPEGGSRLEHIENAYLAA